MRLLGALRSETLLCGVLIAGSCFVACGGEHPEPKRGEKIAGAPPAEVRLNRRIHLMKFEPKRRFATHVNKAMVRIVDDQREAILISPGRRVVFRGVPLYPEAHLEVTLGIPWLDWSQLESPIGFEVRLVAEDGSERVVLEESLDPRHEPSDQTWKEHRVPLPGGTEAGTRVDVVLEASGSGTERLAAWSRPIIVSKGRRSSAESRPLTAQEVLRDLLREEAEDPVERAGVRLFGLEIPNERGAIPALQIQPGTRVEYALEGLPRSATVSFRFFLAGLTRTAAGRLQYQLDWIGPDGDVTELVSTGFDLARLDRTEIGVRYYEDAVALPPGASAGTLRFSLEGEIDEGDVLTGLSRLKIVDRRSIPSRGPGDETPNVLVLLVDTLRADHLGAYGYDRATSPVFDELAGRGLLFENCIAQSSWTLPSTASVLTGVYPQTHGCVSIDTLWLPSTISSLPQALLESGIPTGGFIANCIISERNGFARGFEHFEELCLLPAAELNAEVVDWIRSQRERPFFAYVHYYDPHWPYAAPEPFTRFFEEGGDGEAGDQRMRKAILSVVQGKDLSLGSASPRWEVLDSVENDFEIVSPEHFRVSRWLTDRWRDRYDAEIRYWDHELGRLLEDLDGLGVLDDTWLIVVSDHGEAFGEHDYIGHGANLHDEQVRVPLLIVPPGGRRGVRVASPVELVDIAPTVLAALRLDGGEELPGRSLLPAEKLEKSPAFSVLNDFVPDDMAAVQFPEWKAIQKVEADSWQLYRIPEDPAELEDVAGEKGVPLGQIQDALRRWLEETPKGERQGDAALGASTEAMLRAMGYLGQGRRKKK